MYTLSILHPTRSTPTHPAVILDTACCSIVSVIGVGEGEGRRGEEGGGRRKGENEGGEEGQ
jgi:hypothetical protein